MSLEFVNGVSLMQGDCLERMKEIPDGSADMILADLPYGTTNCDWDVLIPLDQLWEQYWRVVKPNGAVVLFSQMPFSAEMVCSNLKTFRYEWIWWKTRPVGFLNAKRMPLRAHENILVFYKKLPTYNPQKWISKPYFRKGSDKRHTPIYDKYEPRDTGSETGERYPVDVIKFSNAPTNGFHPTQKPVSLLEYLIKTYTNPEDVVLDNVMGSGSTGVAAVNTGRKFIGIELDEKFFETARERIEKAIKENKTPAPEAVF